MKTSLAVRCFLLTGALLLAAPLSALGAGTVGTGTADSCTEAALDAALAGGGLVRFRCGGEPVTIKLTAVKTLAADTTVNGGGLVTLDGDDAVQHFRVPALRSLTLRDITLARARVTSFSVFGGSIYVNSGALVAERVRFVHNRAAVGGGAIYAVACEPAGAACPKPVVTISASVFDDNASPNQIGGAIFAGDAKLTIADSTFTGNASIYGGAIAIYGSSEASITRSTFSGNSTQGSNFSQGHGGAIAVENALAVEISNSTFTGNQAKPTAGNPTPNGGAIFFFDTRFTRVLNHLTVSGNSAAAGGGVFFNGAGVSVRNSIFSANAGGNCGGAFGNIDAGHNLQSGDATCTGFAVADPLLAPLADNGGATRTMALQAGSPALDAADPASSLLQDQRGVPRAQGGAPDIGAYETLPVLVQGRGQGLLWKAPAGSEAGRGYNFAHQGDIVFLTAFLYDHEGKPLWLAAEMHLGEPGVFTGALFVTSGPPFSAVPFDPALVSETTIGSVSVAFIDADNAVLTYDIGGYARAKSLVRQVFASPVPICTWGPRADPPVAALNYQDLWWASPPGFESGWGANFTHQGDIIFVTWYTYGPDGRPLWLIAVAEKTAEGVYAGPVSTVTGPPSTDEPFDPSQVAETVVGSLTITFSGADQATFAYTVNGIAQSKPITRQVFSAPGTVCE